MRVLICGAGLVGYGIAEQLSHEGNDVSVVDTEAELIEHVSDTLDVRGFVGHGAHPEVLESAGARDAEMIIAVTLRDEVNMVACQVAHTLFDIPTKIARIRSQSYLAPHWRDLFSRNHMPIDLIISPEIEVSKRVLKRLSLPGAFEVVDFDDDPIIVAGVSCKDDCPIVDTPLFQLTDLFPNLGSVIVGIVRDGKLFVPSRNDHLLAGDDAYFVAHKDQVERTLKLFGHEEQQARRIIIAGGGAIGFYVAQELERSQSPVHAKILEASRERAIEIADQLSRTIVLHGSSLDQDVLLEADAPDADALIALTNDDQVNILSCVLAKNLGARTNLCLLNSANYIDIVRSMGIDAHVNPRAITVSKILEQVRRGRIRAVHTIHNGEGEVIEAEALETSPVVGMPMRDLDLPSGMRIGAIVRDRDVLMPSGDLHIEARDRVVIFALADRVSEVEKLFRVSLEFF